jgi:hypothetical protein
MSKTACKPNLKVLLLDDNANYRRAFEKVNKKTLEFLGLELLPCRNIREYEQSKGKCGGIITDIMLPYSDDETESLKKGADAFYQIMKRIDDNMGRPFKWRRRDILCNLDYMGGETTARAIHTFFNQNGIKFELPTKSYGEYSGDRMNDRMKQLNRMPFEAPYGVLIFEEWFNSGKPAVMTTSDHAAHGAIPSFSLVYLALKDDDKFIKYVDYSEDLRLSADVKKDDPPHPGKPPSPLLQIAMQSILYRRGATSADFSELVEKISKSYENVFRRLDLACRAKKGEKLIEMLLGIYQKKLGEVLDIDLERKEERYLASWSSCKGQIVDEHWSTRSVFYIPDLTDAVRSKIHGLESDLRLVRNLGAQLAPLHACGLHQYAKYAFVSHEDEWNALLNNTTLGKLVTSKGP